MKNMAFRQFLDQKFQLFYEQWLIKKKKNSKAMKIKNKNLKVLHSSSKLLALTYFKKHFL